MFTRKALQVQPNKHVTAAVANHLQQGLFHITQNIMWLHNSTQPVKGLRWA